MRDKYIKNLKLGICNLIGLLIIILMLLLILIWKYDTLIMLMGIFLCLIFSLVSIFPEHSGLLYIVVINNTGITVRFLKKYIRQISWEEIKEIRKSNPYKAGWCIEIKYGKRNQVLFMDLRKSIQNALIANCPMEEIRNKIAKL